MSFSPSFQISALLFFRFNQTVFAVIPAIYDSRTFRLCIEEHEEIVFQKVHLKDSFFRRHRSNPEMFCAGNFKFRIGSRFFFFHELNTQYFLFLESLGETRFIFMNLTFYFIENQINGFIHIIRFFHTTKNDAIHKNCHFAGSCHIGNPEKYIHFDWFVKISLDLSRVLFYILTQSLCYFKIFSSNA